VPQLLKQQCKALKLAHVPVAYLNITYVDREQYLTELFQAELEARQANKVKRLIKKAGFPSRKLLQDFCWDPVILPENTTPENLTELGFLERSENLLALGAVGTGKTHLAIALGIRACTEGNTVRFYRCLDLANVVIAQAYEHQSLIVTSNLQFGQWNTVLGDNRLTAALIDRLVHHAHILAFEG